MLDRGDGEDGVQSLKQGFLRRDEPRLVTTKPTPNLKLKFVVSRSAFLNNLHYLARHQTLLKHTTEQDITTLIKFRVPNY